MYRYILILLSVRSTRTFVYYNSVSNQLHRQKATEEELWGKKWKAAWQKVHSDPELLQSYHDFQQRHEVNKKGSPPGIEVCNELYVVKHLFKTGRASIIFCSFHKHN